LPLTISHPAAVIPLKKFGFPLSALIIGSMMPDFEFFLRLSSDRVIGHTIPGIFLFCLPVGFIVLLLFHIVIKKPVISLLPQSHHSRIFSVIGSEFRFFPLKQFIKIILALLIGIVSHLFLDSLTHDNSFFTSQIPLLSLSILTTPFGSLRVYFLLQQILSFIGFLLITRWYFIWYRSSTPTILLPTPLRRNQKSKVLLCMILLTLITTSIVVSVKTFTGNTLHHTDLYRAIISNTAVVSVSVTLLVLFLYSICWHFFMTLSTKPDPDAQKE
jgi:hypothetical protein